MISLLVFVAAFLLAAGVLALLLSSRPRLAAAVGCVGAAAGGVVGTAVSVAALAGMATESVSVPWNGAVGASLSLGVDPLSALFLLPVFALTALGGVYGAAYLHPSPRTGGAWLGYDALAASMVVVLLARNAVLFLVAWEIMTIASYFLVVHEREREDARRAGVVYLVASQLGTAALIVMFLLMADAGGAGAVGAAWLDFSRFGPAAAPAVSGAVFLLALAGFGTKAGLVPVHVWLPEAHPAAPSHVSALMSGAMIAMGIYGLTRVVAVVGPGAAWWGWTLLGVGAVTAVLGILHSLAQHDLKRLLAYSSVENMGLVAVGMGMGVLGAAHGQAVVAVLGWGGALLHVLNHAAMKGLLFFGAGSVAHATGTRELDRLGGLARRMPVTGATFVVAAAAICGLPPLGGFVGEFLLFSGALSLDSAFAAALVIVTLGLVGGLAVAAFARAVGIVFLGEPRTPEAASARESPLAMTLPAVLAATCVAAMGIAGPAAVRGLVPIAAGVAGLSAGRLAAVEAAVAAPLRGITAGATALAAICLVLAALRWALLRGRDVRRGPTWDCGYAAPSARMQYTASSFAQPIVDMFRLVLRSRRRLPEIRDCFPAEGSFSSQTDDLFARGVYRPTIDLASRVAAPLRRLQHGMLHLYVLYILIALVALAVWKLG